MSCCLLCDSKIKRIKELEAERRRDGLAGQASLDERDARIAELEAELAEARSQTTNWQIRYDEVSKENKRLREALGEISRESLSAHRIGLEDLRRMANQALGGAEPEGGEESTEGNKNDN